MSAAIKERPMLFAERLVRAILEDRKTNTRRPVKPQPQIVGDCPAWRDPKADLCREKRHFIRDCNPHGQVGDRIWVRETWAEWSDEQGNLIVFRADNSAYHDPRESDKYKFHGCEPVLRAEWNPLEGDTGDDGYIPMWRPSIHMPRTIRRLTLELTEVRIERLHDISLDDIWNEGTQIPVSKEGHLLAILTGKHKPSDYWPVTTYDELRARDDFEYQWARCHFAMNWDEHYGDTAFSWRSNPYVWALAFRRVLP